MTKRRKAYLHVGLPGGTGDFIAIALRRHRHALEALGVRSPATSADEMFRAAVEITRDHRAWGYERRDVEGTWSTMCRRGHKGRDTLVFTAPMLAGATTPQIELLFDGLTGFERHVVITASAPDAWTLPGDPAHDLTQVVDRWAFSARRPERVHVLVHRPGNRAGAWAELGRTVGFGTASLPVDGLAVPDSAVPHPAPTERLTALRAMAHGWIDHLSRSEYDVRGDVTELLPELPAPSVRLPGVLVGGA